MVTLSLFFVAFVVVDNEMLSLINVYLNPSLVSSYEVINIVTVKVHVISCLITVNVVESLLHIHTPM